MEATTCTLYNICIWILSFQNVYRNYIYSNPKSALPKVYLQVKFTHIFKAVAEFNHLETYFEDITSIKPIYKEIKVCVILEYKNR